MTKWSNCAYYVNVIVYTILTKWSNCAYYVNVFHQLQIFGACSSMGIALSRRHVSHADTELKTNKTTLQIRAALAN